MGPERPHLQITRQLQSRQVALVLTRRREQLRLVAGAREQRRPQPRPVEQDRNSGAERAGADDGSAAGMLTRGANAGKLAGEPGGGRGRAAQGHAWTGPGTCRARRPSGDLAQRAPGRASSRRAGARGGSVAWSCRRRWHFFRGWSPRAGLGLVKGVWASGWWNSPGKRCSVDAGCSRIFSGTGQAPARNPAPRS
jgi:hypothetical protein